MLRNLIHDADKQVYRSGQLFGVGVPIGLGMARLSIVDRGEQWEQRAATGAALPPRVVGAPPAIEVWVNGASVPLTPKRGPASWSFDGPGVECFAQYFDRGIYRFSLRVLVDKPITDLRINIAGQSYIVTVEHAAERFPCDVRSVPAGTVITLCDGKTPGTDSAEELGWMLGGIINTTLPPGVADKFAAEITATDQYGHRGVVWRSIDFVVQPQGSDEQLGPPLILERGKWAPLFNGSVEDKTAVELDLLEFYHARVYSRKGWATFGDWPHIPGDPYRTRYNDHYFSITALYRATVRSRVSQKMWHDMARVASTFVRDMCWKDGSKSHGKGLAPWSGPWSVNMHHVDSESLLMAWLVDGDEFALREYKKWLAAFTMPTTPGRDSRAAKRMCDVAFAYTGDQVWRDRATQIQDVELTREENDEPVTGRLWHPEWCDKTILKDRRRPEGIINAQAFPILQAWRPQQRDNKTFALVPDNCGPMGEGHLLLQMHALRTGEAIYGADIGDPRVATRPSTSIIIDKRDDRPLLLHLRLGQRIGGDLHQTSVRVYDPAGKLAWVVEAIPLARTGEDAAGFPVVDYRCGVEGPRGLWRVDVASYALALYAPISEWREHQEGSGWKFPAYQ